MSKNLSLIASILCMLVLSPQLLLPTALTTIQSNPTIISVQTMMNIKPMVVFNTSLVAHEFIKIEHWSNGSKTIHISEHFILNHPDCRDVWVNMTQTISSIQSKSLAVETKTVKPLGGVYPGKYRWDNMLFLPKGNNGTHLVEYDYDDNFDTYYPCEWFTHWNLSRNEYGQPTSLFHVHLSAQEVTDWMNGIKSRSDILAIIFGALGGGLSIIGGIAAFFGCPWAAVPAIIGGISEILATIIALLGITEYNWIRDVVQTWYGDGFTWIGTVVKYISMDWWYCPFWSKPITVYQYYTHAEWQQRWGAERDNPQSYHISWWSYDEIKSAPTSASVR